MRYKSANIKINAKALKKSLNEGLVGSVNVKKAAFKAAEKLAQDAKDEMLGAFEASPVTRELDAGAENTVNFSKNLIGIGHGEGSLFGFIGFGESDNPIGLVREYLNASGKIFKTPKVIKSGGKLRVKNANSSSVLTNVSGTS